MWTFVAIAVVGWFLQWCQACDLARVVQFHDLSRNELLATNDTQREQLAAAQTTLGKTIRHFNEVTDRRFRRYRHALVEMVVERDHLRETCEALRARVAELEQSATKRTRKRS